VRKADLQKSSQCFLSSNDQTLLVRERKFDVRDEEEVIAQDGGSAARNLYDLKRGTVAALERLNRPYEGKVTLLHGSNIFGKTESHIYPVIDRSVKSQ